MHRVFVLIALVALACHHDSAPTPIGPVGPPPLPPASGTPVGYLIDEATKLELSDDQVAKLKDIDSGLSARIESIDAQLRDLGKPPESHSQPAMRGGRRGMRGGMSGGGMNGGGNNGSGSN